MMESALLALGAFAASAGAALEVMKLVKKEWAEKKLCDLIRRDSEAFAAMKTTLEQVTSEAGDAEKLAHTVSEARKLIEGKMAQLDKSQIRLLQEGFSQPSEKGRESYTIKLLTKATARVGPTNW